MCIAIAKRRGIKIPSDEILRNCWDNNNDGAGFAFNVNGCVLIKKGFMNFEDFINTLHKYDRIYDLEKHGLLIHFRIATHGLVNGEMCHPFPITNKNDRLKRTTDITNYAVIHNGIINLTSEEAYLDGELSDTAIFVRDYMTELAKNKNWFTNKSNMDLIYKLIGSKMAIINNGGDIQLIGSFIEDNGVYYSNNGYKTNYYLYY